MPINIQFIKSIDDINSECKLPSAIGKISRSKKSLKENYENDTRETCNNFNKKWIQEKNHGSLTNHSNYNLEIRGVSIAGAKYLEKPRVGVGYTELSTRYVNMDDVKDGNGYFIPLYLRNETLFPKTSKLYKSIIEKIMDHYRELIKSFKEYISKRDNKNIDEIKGLEYLDSARYSLPIALATGLGGTYNATALDSLYKKLIKSGTSEGNEILFELSKLLESTDLKYILNFDKYKQDFKEKTFSNRKSLNEIREEVKNIINYFKNLEIKIVTHDSHDVKLQVSNNDLSSTITKRIEDISDLIKNPEEYDSEGDLKYLEEAQVMILATVDYGAFRDIQRHRMATMRYSDFPTGFECRKLKNGNIEYRPYVCDFNDDNSSYYNLTYYSSELETQMGYNSLDFYKEIHKLRVEMLEAFLEEIKNLNEVELAFGSTYLLELIALTNTLASKFEFKCVANVREILHMIKQRTKSDSHISYKIFFEMVKDWLNIFVKSENLGYAVSTESKSERF